MTSMATFDINAPAAAIAPTDATARRHAARWREIEPFARQRLQALGDTSSAAYAALRDLHRSRLLLLDAVGIEMRVVRRHALDDPRATDDEFRRNLAAAHDRRHPKERR